MFRCTDPQGKLFSSFNLLTERQESRIKETWAPMFCDKALPLINENAFADMYHESQGAPNKSVTLLFGLLILKDMFDFTDEQTLDSLMFDKRWQVALNLDADSAYCSQKTLHNFRVKLIEHEKALLLFEHTCGAIIEALSLKTDKQRLDSTHIRSNMADLTRLGICCESIRLFLRDIKKHEPGLYQRISERLRRRYLKDDQSRTRYEDVKRDVARKRLPVAGRDLYRLRQLFKNETVLEERESFQLLLRALNEQFDIVEAPQAPAESDADAGEESIPIQPKDQSPTGCLQSPYEPDATYGKKGIGYETQVAETFGNKEADDEIKKPEVITHVRVTNSCDNDIHSTLPAIDDLAKRGIQPKEILLDSNYAGSATVLEAEDKGTEIIGPVKGGDEHLPGPEEITIGDFQIDRACFDEDNAPTPEQVRCPNGCHPIEHVYDAKTGRLKIFFQEGDCQACPFAEKCPAKPATSPKPETPRRFISIKINDHKKEQRRRAQTTEAFHKRYAPRAGIEATNSELKRAHGLGNLRVRRRKRVELAVYLKALACNMKRYVRYHVDIFVAACRGTVPALCM